MSHTELARENGAIPLLVGVTGHRNLRGQDIPSLEQRVREVFQEYQTRYPHTPLILLSPLAEGADRLVGRVALEMGIRVRVPVPMPLAPYVNAFTVPASRAAFERLLG